MNKKPLLYGAVLLGTVVTAVIIAEKFIKRPGSSRLNPNAPASTDKTTRIAAPPERVWQAMSQIDQWAGWQPDISKAKLNGPLQAGSTFDWNTSGMAIHSTLHTVTPPEALGWSGEAFGAFAVHNWHFNPLTDGTTEVRVEESMEGWLVSVLGSVLQKNLDEATDRWLEALKKVAEAE
ncbi:SRPBCC family protein [Spirosoma luteum]|uniref:SRPBCC family protein n=1 Tax=Spirosoma luteum TaxID=431553 RepID=UPI00037DECE4|nr:SRPBCC family protein [Spirosoma luteum]